MYDPLLDTFICVIKSGSFSKAAERLYVSTTAVQKQINLLEEKVGVPLFIRNKKGVQLTQCGDFFYGKALSIIKESKKNISETRLMVNTDFNKNDIKVGTSIMLPAHHMSEWLQSLPQHHINSKVILVPISPYITDYHDIKTLFDDDTINCICIPKEYEITDSTVDFYYLDEAEICLAIPSTNPLSEFNTISYQALENQTLIMMEKGYCEAYDRIRNDILETEISLNIINVKDGYTPDTFNQCVQDGSIILTIDCWADSHPNMKVVHLDKKYYLEYGVLMRK